MPRIPRLLRYSTEVVVGDEIRDPGDRFVRTALACVAVGALITPDAANVVTSAVHELADTEQMLQDAHFLPYEPQRFGDQEQINRFIHYGDATAPSMHANEVPTYGMGHPFN